MSEVTMPNTDTTVQSAPSVEVEIDGQKYTLDDVKTWKSGHMMQADYTKKTQELASERKELAQMKDLRDYLNANPSIARQVADVLSGRQPEPTKAKPAPKKDDDEDEEDDDEVVTASKDDPRITDMDKRLRQFEIKEKLDDLVKKYPDADPAAILQASINHRTTDFEMLYHVLQGEKVGTPEYRKKIREEVLAELNAESDVHTDTMASGKSTPPSLKTAPKLTADEARIAKIYGMSAEEYAKWKS